MKPVMQTAILHGTKVTNHRQGWAELLGIPGGSWDRVFNQHGRSLQNVIEAYQDRHWEIRRYFLFRPKVKGGTQKLW